MFGHLRISLREALLVTALTAASLAVIRYPSWETERWVHAFEFLLFMMVPAVILGGGWKRHTFAIGFLFGLSMYRFFPGIQHPSYLTQSILALLPRPTF
jgi:hypothetical protein